MKLFRCFLGLLLLVVSVQGLSAQSLNTSQISGVVEDATGLSCPMQR